MNFAALICVIFALVTVGSCGGTTKTLQGTVQCSANGPIYALYQYSSSVAAAFAGSNVPAANNTLCARTARLANLPTLALQDCTRSLLTATGRSTFLGGSDEAVEGQWRWLDTTTGRTEECHDHFWQGTAGGSCRPGYNCNWGSGEPNDGGGNEDFMISGGTAQWNDYNGNTDFALYEYEACATPVGSSQSFDVANYSAWYQLSANDVTITINYQTAFKVFIDVNGHTGGQLTISAATRLYRGLEIYDSSGSQVTNFIIQSNAGAYVNHIVLRDATGVEFRGALSLNSTCTARSSPYGIRGTVARGNLVFNNAQISDGSSRTDTTIEVEVVAGNLVIQGGSSFNIDAFLVSVRSATGTISCTDSNITATGTSTVTFDSKQWSAVSIGLANTNSGTATSLTTINLNNCRFTGQNRGYFNYFNRQVITYGGVNAVNSIFSFTQKLRVRVSNGYTLYLGGSTLSLTGGSGILTIGNTVTSTRGSTVTIEGSTINGLSNLVEFSGQLLNTTTTTATTTNNIRVYSG